MREGKKENNNAFFFPQLAIKSQRIYGNQTRHCTWNQCTKRSPANLACKTIPKRTSPGGGEGEPWAPLPAPLSRPLPCPPTDSRGRGRGRGARGPGGALAVAGWGGRGPPGRPPQPLAACQRQLPPGGGGGGGAGPPRPAEPCGLSEGLPAPWRAGAAGAPRGRSCRRRGTPRLPGPPGRGVGLLASPRAVPGFTVPGSFSPVTLFVSLTLISPASSPRTLIHSAMRM